MMKNFLDDPRHRLWWVLTQTRDAIWKARIKELHQYGLTPNRSAVLVIVQALGGEAVPSEIARWIFRTPHSVSELLIRMEKEGLIRKVSHPTNKKLVIIKLEKKALQILSHSTKRESVNEIFSVLSDREFQQLLIPLLKLRERAMKQIEIETPLPESD
jgi:DNA-binding MarR family transcriptional regulator